MIIIAGEALVDMVAAKGEQQQFSGIPGGAAFNVACALGLLDAKPSFACPISTDNFGKMLLERMNTCKVTALLQPRVTAPTPLALVTVDNNSQPSYSFYREGTADRMLHQFNMQDVAPPTTTLLHISGFCLNEFKDFQEWMKLVNAAKANGAIISVDPNVRDSLISDPNAYRDRIKSLLAIADVVKVSDEDLQYLYPDITLDDAKAVLRTLTSLSIVTLGSKGADIHWDGKDVHVDAHKLDKIVDTVGAGDCFSAGYLYQLNHLGITQADHIASLTQEQVVTMVKFASTAAAINCGRKGCQPPTVTEINDYQASH